MDFSQLTLLKEAKRQKYVLEAYNSPLIRKYTEEIMGPLNEVAKWGIDSSSNPISIFNDNYEARLVAVRQYIVRVANHIDIYHSIRIECITNTVSRFMYFLRKDESRMHRSEYNFSVEYMQNLKNYESTFDDVLNISSYSTVPNHIFIEVRALKDCGCIQTENGEINLSAGSLHYVRKADVQDLIFQGFVKHVK